MKIVIAKTAGFCFGVKRAVDMAFSVAKTSRGKTYMFGSIIHNPQVIEKLKESGVISVDCISELKKKKVNAVIIRTHGVPAGIMEKLNESGYKIIDATCPFVKKAQHYAKLLKEEGYKVVILGNKEHPEVKGLMSYAGKGCVVVRDKGEFGKLSGRIGIVVQTTQRIDNLKGLLDSAIEKARELKVYNTICSSTALKLKETGEIAKTVDAMIIVGGKNSANTTQLANLTRAMSVPTYHIETAAEIDDSRLKSYHRIGITAGASTPDWIIKEVKKRVENIGGKPGQWKSRAKNLKNSTQRVSAASASARY